MASVLSSHSIFLKLSVDPKQFSTILAALISGANETVKKCQSLPSIKLASL